MEINQVFLSNPADLSHCHNHCHNHSDSTSMSIAHGKYIYNLCREESSYQIDLMTEELLTAHSQHMDLIIHQGKNIESEGLTRLSALNNYINGVKTVLDNSIHVSNKIILENSSKQGTELGYSLKELSYVIDEIDNDRIGLCIDTCHAFTSGECDFRSISHVEQYIEDLHEYRLIDKLSIIHLNDCQVPFGACNDHHADFSAGYITDSKLSGNFSGIHLFIKEIIDKKSINYVFETPCTRVSIEDQRRLLHLV